MSLLYEALLKNNQNKSASETQAEKSAVDVSENRSTQADSINTTSKNSVNHSDLLTNSANVKTAQKNKFTVNEFASAGNSLQQVNKHIPSLVWIFIGSLLLVVGLLAGYIYGNALLANNSEIMINAEAKKEPELVITTIPTVENPLKPQVETITEVGGGKSVTNEYEDKTIEIALDPQGQVISKVSQLTDKQTKPVSVNTGNESKPLEVIPQEQDMEELNSSDDQMSLNDVPDQLKASFAEAIKATEQQIPDKSFESFEINLSPSTELLMLDDLTGYQVQSLPDLIYQMHIFSSDISERWVRVNGKTLYEGYELQDGLTLLEIKQDLIVWRFNTLKVGQLALVDFIK